MTSSDRDLNRGKVSGGTELVRVAADGGGYNHRMAEQHTVFYAWQSDRDESVCRYFIREAAKKAIKRIAHGRLQTAPSLDHDTKNATGTPHIADTIQRKIKRCGVFVADVTYVSKYRTFSRRTKNTPNPNVMIELGIAARTVGWERILLVMNTAFGKPDDLPFDLKHHSFPIQFHLLADGDRKAVFTDLADKLYQKLNPIFANGIIEAAGEKKCLMSVSVSLTHQDHVRLLYVDVINKSVALNNVQVTMEYGAVKPFRFGFSGKKPEPFAPHNSGRFFFKHSEPHQSVQQLIQQTPDKIFIVVRSGIRVISRIPATQWLTELEGFRQPNFTMPAKPVRVWSMPRKPLGW